MPPHYFDVKLLEFQQYYFILCHVTCDSTHH